MLKADAIAAPRPRSPARYWDSFMLHTVAPRFVYCKHQASKEKSTMLRMKTINEIRYTNLERLVADAGGLTELVEKSNGKLSRPTLDQILKKRTTARGTVKNVGDDLARDIEKCLRLQAGWMDNVHGGQAEALVIPPEFVNAPQLAKLVIQFAQATDHGRMQILRAADLAEKAFIIGDVTAPANNQR
jgi:hypothetical protein